MNFFRVGHPRQGGATPVLAAGLTGVQEQGNLHPQTVYVSGNISSNALGYALFFANTITDAHLLAWTKSLYYLEGGQRVWHNPRR